MKGKGAAVKAFQKAIRLTAPEIVIQGALRYKLDPNRSQTYTAHPATWLNAQRWLDDALPERIKTIDEKKADELRIAKEKETLARDQARQYFEEQEAARARAVPMPETLRSLLKK
jgi:hypothetical protein